MQDPESRELLSWIERSATPAHEVRVAPFLCAKDPVSLRAARHFLGSFADDLSPFWAMGASDDAIPCSLDAVEAAALADRVPLRMLSEAEWELLARDGGAEHWINGDPEQAARACSEAPSPRAARPGSTSRLGLWGLPMGEWVRDGWHASYGGAPKTADAWDPEPLPGVVRGPSARSYPWQLEAECLFGHAAFRTPRDDDAFATANLRLGLDLPRL